MHLCRVNTINDGAVGGETTTLSRHTQVPFISIRLFLIVARQSLEIMLPNFL
jgi:hypothetical protein